MPSRRNDKSERGLVGMHSPRPIDPAVFRRLEEALLAPGARGSRAFLEAALAEDFLEIGRSGFVYDKATTIKALCGEEGSAPVAAIGDFVVRPLGDDIVLATDRTRRADGSRPTLRASIWRREAGRWRLAFHQGTPAAE